MSTLLIHRNPTNLSLKLRLLSIFSLLVLTLPQFGPTGGVVEPKKKKKKEERGVPGQSEGTAISVNNRRKSE